MAGIETGAVIAITIKAIDSFSSIFEKLGSGLGGIGKMAGIGVAALVTGTGIVVKQMSEMAVSAASAQEVQESFNKVVGNDSVWKQMQSNVLGTVDKYTLMATATTAVQRGIKQDALPAIAQFAEQMAKANPQFSDVTSTINNLTTAIATGRTQSLAQYGIQLDVTKASKAYVEQTLKEQGVTQSNILTSESYLSTLTDSQKAKLQNMSATDLAIESEKAWKSTINAQVLELGRSGKAMVSQGDILDALQTKMKQMPTPTADLSEQMEQMKTQMTEAKDTIGTALIPAFSQMMTSLAPLIPKLVPPIQQLLVSLTPLLPVITDLFINILSSAVPIVQNLIPPVLDLAKFISELFNAVKPLLPSLTQLTGTLLTSLLSILMPLMPAIEALVPPLANLLNALMPIIVPITQLLALLVKIIADPLKNLGPAINAVLPIITFLVNAITDVVNIVMKAVDWIRQLIDWISKISLGVIQEVGKVVGGIFGGGHVTKVGDAIIKPTGEIIQTSPNDTLIATKNPGGMGGMVINFTVQGDLIGLDASDISRMLSQELYKKMTF